MNKMTGARYTHLFINIALALIWTINGLFCKILNMVPRHEQIVARILGPQFSLPITRIIGILEVLMAVWILSGIKRRLNAVAQMLIVAVMNTIEFILAPDLLLFGRVNALLAALLVIVIYVNEWIVAKKINQ